MQPDDKIEAAESHDKELLDGVDEEYKNEGWTFERKNWTRTSPPNSDRDTFHLLMKRFKSLKA